MKIKHGLAALGVLLCLAACQDVREPAEPVETPTPVEDEAMHTIEEHPDKTASTGAQPTLVGAIRWDAWFGELGVPGQAVERSLGPEHWHDRLPFFAEVVSDTKVILRGDSQDVMDQEIAYASVTGLDYWAFVTYDPADPMSLGMQRYLSSAHKADINFCMIVEGSRLGSGGLALWPDKVQRYLSYFAEPSYQRVMGNRPLMYIFEAQPAVAEGHFASFEEARGAIAGLREASVTAGLGNPYIVIQSWSEGQAAMFMQFLKADAISAYASSAGEKRAPYAALAAHTEAWWDKMAETGAEVIPLVSSGWDRRPRVENPVPWEGQRGSMDEYYERPTPGELAQHLAHGLAWVEAHPDAAPARAVLIYAWNENDEGGWIVPTLSEGTAHLDAIAEVLRKE